MAVRRKLFSQNVSFSDIWQGPKYTPVPWLDKITFSR